MMASRFVLGPEGSGWGDFTFSATTSLGLTVLNHALSRNCERKHRRPAPLTGAGLRLWPSYGAVERCSVAADRLLAVVVALVRAGHVDADVLGLRLGQHGQLG